MESFYDEIRSSIRRKAESGRSKYATYLSINPNLEIPSIYNYINHKKHISMVAKLRTSSHNLRIEMGRRVGQLREQRVCHCGEAVEDEFHFLCECGFYDEVRRRHGIVRESVEEILSDAKYVGYIKELVEKRKELV